MRRQADPVRHYSLYGEPGHLADVMHCETIAERSVLHDWELAPHRHDRLHQLLLVLKGGGSARLDDGSATLRRGSLVNVPIGTVHSFAFAPGTDGFVVTLTDALLDELLAREPEVRQVLVQAFVKPAGAGVRALTAQLAGEYAGRAAGQALVLRGLAAALLGCAARSQGPAGPTGDNLAKSDILHRFDALLEAHFLEHWRVCDYARALALTPTHLTRTVRLATGAPASALIDMRVIREARRQLAFTSLSVKSIAYMLGFADPALFSRVFARVAGLSPRAFRRQVAVR